MAKTKLIVSGPTETKEVLLDPKGLTLGRGSNCDVILDDGSVSRHHARIYQDPFGRWIVEDLESQNGVLIDGKRIKAQAVLPKQEINIRPFTLAISQESDQETVTGRPVQAKIPIVDKGPEEDIISYGPDKVSNLSPVLMKDLNELTGRLLELSSPSTLYSEACSSLAKMLNTLVAIVRLPCTPQPLPRSPDILACHFEGDTTDSGAGQRFYLNFSKRVLEAVRSADIPVMASSRPSPDHGRELTIIDEHEPHIVFSARVNDLGESVDALYVDILEKKSPEEMFDFVEVAARQIDFAQKNLFLAVLRKHEKALREANTQLKEKDRIKDEYVSRVTHDIKGHLAAIQSCLHIASDRSAGPLNEKQSEFLSRARRRTAQLSDFVKELLNLTQMRLSGQLKMAPFSLPACISKALASVETKAKDKAITLTSHVASSLDLIVGDGFSINEMLTNLLFDAVKYTPEGKTVHLEAKDQDDCVQIDVADTGIGIPADEIAHVFDEFFRASNAKEREGEGTGLGLSIVKQIVERHSGRISVQSQEGQGTTFSIVLPKSSPTSVCS